MTDTVSLIIELITSLFDSVLFVYFIIRYNRATFKTSRLTIPTVLLLFAVTLIGDFLLPGFSTVISIALFLIATLFSLKISPNNKLRAIVASCIYEMHAGQARYDHLLGEVRALGLSLETSLYGREP